MGVFRLLSSFLLCDRCFSSKTGFGNFSILKSPLTKLNKRILSWKMQLNCL